MDPLIMTRKVCVDCKEIFDDPHDLRKKCWNCLDRDQMYRERGIQEEKGYGYDEE